MALRRKPRTDQPNASNDAVNAPVADEILADEAVPIETSLVPITGKDTEVSPVLERDSVSDPPMVVADDIVIAVTAPVIPENDHQAVIAFPAKVRPSSAAVAQPLAPVIRRPVGSQIADADDGTLIAPREAAAMMGITAGTLGRWRHQGRGPACTRLSSRVVRYRRGEIASFLAERTISFGATV